MIDNQDLIKDRTATIRFNQDLLQKFLVIRCIIEKQQGKNVSDGITWLVCLGLALENPINADLLTPDKNVNIKKQIRVHNKALKDISRLKVQLKQYKTIKSDVEVWRYCLKLAYYVLVGDGKYVLH